MLGDEVKLWKNILDNLKNLLQKDDRLISEDEPRRTGSAVLRGELLKNKVIELAIKLDKGLIELLLSDEQMRAAFFIYPVVNAKRSTTGEQIGKVTIFDKDKFIKRLSGALIEKQNKMPS